MNKCGLYTWFGYILPIEDKLKMISDVGFETICTWWGDDFDETDGDYRDHAELASKYGLYLEHSHIPYYGCDKLWTDTLDGEEILKMHINSVKTAGVCSVPTLVMHPHERVMPQGTKYELFCDNLQRILEQCDKSGVNIALENLSDDGLIRKVQDMVRDVPFAGLCFDSGHNNVATDGNFSLLDDYDNKVFALHIHDNNGLKDEHVMPFEGNVDWTGFMQSIDNTNFSGSLMLECCYPFDFDKFEDDPDYVFVPTDMTAIEYLQKAKSACDRVYETLKK